MVSVQDVSDKSLQSQTIPAVRTAAEFALVSVPVVVFGIDARPFVSGQQFVQVPDPHRTAHNLTHTRQQDVHLMNGKDTTVKNDLYDPIETDALTDSVSRSSSLHRGI